MMKMNDLPERRASIRRSCLIWKCRWRQHCDNEFCERAAQQPNENYIFRELLEIEIDFFWNTVYCPNSGAFGFEVLFL